MLELSVSESVLVSLYMEMMVISEVFLNIEMKLFIMFGIMVDRVCGNMILCCVC